MKKSLIRALMTVLALVGLADSAYLTDMAYLGEKLTCNIDGLDGCNTVAQSVYSKVLGLPLALYGVLFYLAVLAILFSYKHFSASLYRKALILSTGVGALLSTYFLYLQKFVIDALCVYCVGSALVSYLLFILIFVEKKEEIATPPTL